MIPKLLSVKEAAHAVNVTEDAIYRAVRKGQIAHVRIGGIRFTEADLQAWIERATHVPLDLKLQPSRVEPEPDLRGTGRYH